MKRNLLLTPGPTQIPPDICAALGRPLIHHRTPQFQEILKEVISGLQYVLQTQNDVYLLASSGTGSMEAAVANLLSVGDCAITVEGGKFGERWTELCGVYGVKAEAIKVPWGKAVHPDQIKTLLEANKNIKAVFVTLCETSTGVTSDIKAIADVVKNTDAVLVVDGISGVGVTEFKMDDWEIDVVIAGSHKGFMLPPGLSFIAVNDKAFKLVERSTSPRYYFDLRKSKQAFARTDTPFTPAIGIIVALRESLRGIRERGLENMLASYARLARGMRAAAKALGLTLLADESCISNVLTAIHLPEGMNSGEVVRRMRDTHGITIANGQGYLKGRTVRFGHMGCIDEHDILTGISCFEKVLQEMGHDFTLGAGLSAAQREFNQSLAEAVV